jgi:hypothetical protein
MALPIILAGKRHHAILAATAKTLEILTHEPDRQLDKARKPVVKDRKVLFVQELCNANSGFLKAHRLSIDVLSR